MDPTKRAAGDVEARAGLVMALGTAAARVSGYARTVLVVAALGSGLHADLFAVANTIPTVLAVMLGAGVVNAVLVPQVVRADRRGDGAAYVDQVITLLGGVLLLGTVLLTAAAPLVLRLFLAPGLSESGFAAQRDSAVALAYLCLPQVFFYGVFALVGQVLNARGVFGPMMWAPVLNNLIAVGVLVVYLVVHGSASDPCGAYSAGQERLLGLGSTAGVVLQCLVLVPFLRRAGVRFRPTVAVLSPAVRRTLRLGAWTVGFVLVNQVAYAVVVRLATAGTLAPGTCGRTDAGTGYTVYSSAFLLVMAVHGVVTVSVTTASLPRLARLASDGDRRGLGAQLGACLRTVMVVVVPTVVLLELVAAPVAELVWGYGAGAGGAQRFRPTIACFGIGLVFFTAHHVALRGLFALEANRAVLGVQAVVAAVNVVVAVLITNQVDPVHVAPALALAYATAYACGAALAWRTVSRRLGSPGGRRTRVALLRVAAAALAAAAVCAIANVAITGQAVPVAGSRGACLASAAATSLVFVTVYCVLAARFGVLSVPTVRRALTRRGRFDRD